MRRALLALTAAAIALTIPVASAQAANPWIEKRAPLNIAHQGGEDEFPSNTLYAFHKAMAAGADMLELDVGVTKDGQVVVMHDTTVDRKTNGHGTVSSKTLSQIKRLDARVLVRARRTTTTRTTTRARAYRFRGIATGRKPRRRASAPRTSACPTLARC